mgnify:FL=1
MRAQFVRGGDPKEVLDIGINLGKRKINVPIGEDGIDDLDKAIEFTLQKILPNEEFYRLVFSYEEAEDETEMADWIEENMTKEIYKKEIPIIDSEEINYGQLNIYKILENGYIIRASMDYSEAGYYWIGNKEATEFLFHQFLKIFIRNRLGYSL